MARREITEAGQQRLDRYKQRRDEYLRKLARLAPPLSEEQKARLAVLLAPAVEEYRTGPTVLTAVGEAAGRLHCVQTG